MKSVPSWSFLAVEPSVRLVIKRKPLLTNNFLRCPAASSRAKAFWELYGMIEREVAKTAPQNLEDKHRLSVQIFYALVDLTELQNASDKEIQRRLTAVFRYGVSIGAPMAVVAHSAMTASVA